MLPIKVTTSHKEIRFSEWLKSLRKDIECTFEILKQRFRILKLRIRTHSIDIVDNIFKTCCTLHNHLLKVDGLDVPWNREHKTSSCEDDNFEDHNATDIPVVMHKLHRNNGHLNRIDFSAMGSLNPYFCENFNKLSYK